MSLATGSQFAGYRVGEEVGRGGMGIVYRAEALSLGRTVALKVIGGDLDDPSGELRRRFVRESRLAASLDHPNVVPIYEAGEHDATPFIAMRFVEGPSLAGLLRGPGRVDPALAAQIVTQVASALDAAHAGGLIHRDVKPANVLLHAAPQPGAPAHAYLTDFGLAKLQDSGSSVALTNRGDLLGTPEFAAPEQIQGGDVDGRADVYALGCLLFAMLAGTSPFRREGTLKTAWAQVYEAPPPISSLRPELAALDPVLAQALAKDPSERPATAGALAGEVSAALGVHVPRGPAAAPATAETVVPDRRPGGLAARQAAETVIPPPRPAASPGRRRVWPWVAGGLAALALVAGAAVLLLSGGDGDPVRAVQGPDAGTVRCEGGECRQSGVLVRAPSEASACEFRNGVAGTWTRLSPGGEDLRLLGCTPDETQVKPDVAAAPAPDLRGATPERAVAVLIGQGVAFDGDQSESEDPIGEAEVCSQSPEPGETVPADGNLSFEARRDC